MKKFDQRGDTPTMLIDDSLKVEVVTNLFKFRKYSKETELTDLIVDAINRMGGAGESAEDDYRLCVDRLCRKSKLVTQIIQDEYFDMPEDAYLDRWALMMLAVELQHKNSLAFFNSVLEESIPEEVSEDPHSFTTVGEEVMIRTTAVEGLERMAENGSDEAIEMLFDNVNHEVFSIRRAASQAIMAVGGKDAHERLKKVLPKRHHGLLKIQRTDVRKAEQAQGGLFLKNKDDDSTPAPSREDSDKQS